MKLEKSTFINFSRDLSTQSSSSSCFSGGILIIHSIHRPRALPTLPKWTPCSSPVGHPLAASAQPVRVAVIPATSPVSRATDTAFFASCRLLALFSLRLRQVQIWMV